MVRFYEPLGQALFWALPGALSLAAALMVASCEPGPAPDETHE